MEQPEHGFAYAFETFTIFVKMSITTKTRFGDSSVHVRQQSLDQPGTSGLVAARCGPITCVWRTLLAFGHLYLR